MLSLLAAAVLAQCATEITDNAQTFCGNKTLSGVTVMSHYFSANGDLSWGGRSTSGFVQRDLVLGGAVRAMLSGTGLVFLSQRAGADQGADFTFRAETGRDGGSAISVLDGTGSEYFIIDNGGRVVSRCANNAQTLTCGGFQEGNAMSGHVTLKAYPGLYLPIAGDLPLGYWGAHGAVTISNLRPMIAGFIGEFANPDTNSGADKKLMVTWQGGLSQFGGYRYGSAPFLAPCDGASDHPVNDGGPGYYVALDAGQAPPGTQMWANDLKRWCHCEPTTGMDGGPLAGWKRWDGQGCNAL